MTLDEKLRIAGVLLSLSGTIVLAYRVTTLLKMLALSVRMHDLNFKAQAIRATGDNSTPFMQVHGMDTHIEKTENSGTKLLIVGFGLQILGGGANVLALICK